MAAFAESFKQLTGHEPYRWQVRLFETFCRGDIPAALDLPTGAGKTAVMPIWLLARKAGAAVPRRLIYVVDRRAVVDQATTVAQDIAEKYPELAVSTLRGRLADNRAWFQDPVRPVIVVGTIDMIGSRLLFSGYGVSKGMRPLQAGLLGADSLVVLDEAHLSAPFEALLRAVADERQGWRKPPVPAMRFMALSATGQQPEDGHGVGDPVFRLREEEQADEPIRKRLEAPKHLKVEAIADGKLAEEMTRRALELAGGNQRVLIYCDSRKTAVDVGERLRKALNAQDKKAKLGETCVALLVGARRVREREQLARHPAYVRFARAEERGAETAPAFLVATAAGEVGVDLDADHMICDLVPFERMVQRLGRVNRAGRAVPAMVDVLVDAKAARKGEEERLGHVRRLLEGLPPVDGDRRLASPAALARLRNDPEKAQFIKDATTPDPLRPPLERATVEAWSLTSLKEHTGRPEVAPWLRGWGDDEPQTQIVWREYLPWRVGAKKPDPETVEAFFSEARPHLSEILDTETRQVDETLRKRADKVLAEQPESAGYPALIILERDGRFRAAYTIGQLAGLTGAENKARRDALLRDLRHATVIVSRALGGLNKEGLLDAKAKGDELVTLDRAWDEDSAGAPSLAEIGYQVRTAGAGEPGGGWTPVYHCPMGEDDSDEAGDKDLLVYVFRGRKQPAAGDWAVAAREQSLQEHHAWAEQEARQIAQMLGLPQELSEALAAAAALHDAGKACERWQDYANNAAAFRRDPAKALAKFSGKANSDKLKLGEGAFYRHEFGSLRVAEENERIKALPAPMRDLALHLIAAHHGRARPLIPPYDDDSPPSMTQARARDVALRFARLQQEWGPWGLAWLEALFRTGIDWRASARLQEEEAQGAKEAVE